MPTPLILVHGYSDSSKGFQQWRDALIKKRRLEPNHVHTINYISLANEVTIRDIAEGFDYALKHEIGLGEEEEFDVIVHSTGMLVIRAWLSRFAPIVASQVDIQGNSGRDKNRMQRLRHLVALAPATNGSPVAHQGRSWLGALAKGNRDFGPDFMESGHQVLSALELASPFTWDLAEKDMFGSSKNDRFRKGDETPFVFTICGDTGLGGASDFATELIGTKTQGSDGVVRWAGAALNSRRLVVDFTVDNKLVANLAKRAPETSPSDWSNQENILVLWPGLNHGTIMKPKNEAAALIDIVSDALDVRNNDEFLAWNKKAMNLAQSARNGGSPPRNWQQFVIRVIDERGDSVPDWTLSLQMKMKGEPGYTIVKIDDLHPYENDKSYRCLHIDLTSCHLDQIDFIKKIEAFEMRMFMSTSSQYTIYMADCPAISEFSMDPMKGITELVVDLAEHLIPGAGSFGLIKKFTTTYIEFRVNRDPVIEQQQAKVCHVDKKQMGRS